MSLLGDISQAITSAIKAVKEFFSPSPPSPVASCPPTGFATQDEAAKAAMEAANPQSIKDNLEYSGLIYQGSDGRYYYTGPVQGSDSGANPWSDAPLPPGTQEAAYYHTHAAYSLKDPTTGAAIRTDDPTKDGFNSDNFSEADRDVADDKAANIPGYAGYVGTPGGKYKKYDPATGNDTEL
jgi:hypothetical protein